MAQQFDAFVGPWTNLQLINIILDCVVSAEICMRYGGLQPGTLFFYERS